MYEYIKSKQKYKIGKRKNEISVIAWEQALLFGRAKRAARERASQRRSREGQSRLLSRASRACTFHDIPQMESLLVGYISECSIILPWHVLVNSLLAWTGFRIMISCCDPGGKGNAALCGDSSLAFGPALQRSSLSNSSNLIICFYRLAHVLRAYPRHSFCYHQLQR